MYKMMVILLLFPSICFGLLNEIDSEFGSNTITVDDETNLAWLDLTVTIYISPNEMEILLQPDGEYYGWRYPTRDELGFLFYESAGLPGTTYNENPIDNYFGPEYVELYLEFMNKVGITNYPIPSIPETGSYTYRLTGYIPYGTEPGLMAQGDVGVNFRDLEAVGCFAQTCIGGMDMDFPNNSVGHWLVRYSDNAVPTEKTSWGSLKSLWN